MGTILQALAILMLIGGTFGLIIGLLRMIGDDQ